MDGVFFYLKDRDHVTFQILKNKQKNQQKSMNIDSKLTKNCLLIQFCRIASKSTLISLYNSDKSSFG